MHVHHQGFQSVHPWDAGVQWGSFSSGHLFHEVTPTATLLTWTIGTNKTVKSV
jgi:hypothetical protein